MSETTGFRPVYRKVRSRLQLSMQSTQVSDAYLFHCWRKILGAEKYTAILVMRELALEMERKAEMGIPTDWDYTTNLLENVLGVPRTTWYRWLKDPNFALFVRKSEGYTHTTVRDARGQVTSKPVIYDIEMETPLTQDHQRWFDARSEEELDEILTDPHLRSLSAIFARFPMPEPEVVFSEHREVGFSPMYQDGTTDEDMKQNPMYHSGTTDSSLQNIHQLSTSYPPPMYQNEAKIAQNGTYTYVPPRHIEGEDQEGEDHYDFIEVATQRLYNLFDPRAIGAPDLRVFGITSVRFACRMLAQTFDEYEQEHGVLTLRDKAREDIVIALARIAWQNANASRRSGTEIESGLGFIKWHLVSVMERLGRGEDVQVKSAARTTKPTATAKKRLFPIAKDSQ